MPARTRCSVCDCVTFSGAEPPKCASCKRLDHKPSIAYKNGCRCAECLDYNAKRARRWAGRFLVENGVDYTSHLRNTGRLADTRRHPRRACGWCGAIHALNASGTTLDAEGLTHAQWLRHYGPPSGSREVALPVAQVPLSALAECRHCGVPFMVDALGRARPYCSQRCRDRAAWGRRKGARGEFTVSSKERRELHERDRWTCRICNESTTREYDPSDPLSPTLDHIEPRSKGGSDSAENLRTAHAICNSPRGAGATSDAEVAIAARRGASRVSA